MSNVVLLSEEVPMAKMRAKNCRPKKRSAAQIRKQLLKKLGPGIPGRTLTPKQKRAAKKRSSDVAKFLDKLDEFERASARTSHRVG